MLKRGLARGPAALFSTIVRELGFEGGRARVADFLEHLLFERPQTVAELLAREETFAGDLEGFGLLELALRRVPPTPSGAAFVRRELELDVHSGLVARETLADPGWERYPELVERLIDKKRGYLIQDLVDFSLWRPHWTAQPQLVTRILETGLADRAIERILDAHPHWAPHAAGWRNILERRRWVREAEPERRPKGGPAWSTP